MTRLRILWLLPASALLLLAIGVLIPRMLGGSTAPGTTIAAGTPSPAVGVGLTPSSKPNGPVGIPTEGGRAQGAPMVSPATPSLAAATPPKRVVLGYYVPYDATSWASFQAQAGALDYVAAQWVSVDACGGIGSRDDRTLVAYASTHGVKVLPSLLTSTAALNHILLTDLATSERFLGDIVDYVVEMGYPGFDLDLEGIDAEDRDAYSAFVARLAEALHNQGKILTLAIPAKASDVRTGWAGPYDYAALGKHADLILLMTYDYSWSSGPPGSIAPQDWVDRVAAYAVRQMPASKVLLGLAFYGYDWNTTLGGRARALLYPQAAALAQQYGAQIAIDQKSLSGTFTYAAKPDDPMPPPPQVPAVQNDIAVRTPGPCPGVTPAPTSTPRPPTTPTPAPPAPPTSTPVPIQHHIVWLEDATSAAVKLQIAARHGVAGVGAWRLGQEDPAVWEYLSNYRSGR